MKAVTDSGTVVQATDDKPALSNLLEIYSLLAGQSIQSLEERYAGRGYGDFKRDLATLVVEQLAPLQQKYRDYMAEQEGLIGILSDGQAKANTIATAKLIEVKEKIGLV